MTDDASRHADRSGAPDWDAIARYLAGESPAEEATRIARWFESHPGDKQLVERLNESAVVDAAADVDVDAALRQVHARMVEASATPRLKVERGGVRRSRSVVLGVLLAAAAGFVAFAVINRPASPTAASSVLARVYTTTTGQRDSIRLADGSRVILGPDSRLTVPGDFGTGVRSVELRGDGYFDVVHDETKPFAVRVANAIIEDVGTTFSVESDRGDTTSVSVLSGVVRLRSASAPPAAGTMLSAGDRGMVTSAGTVRAQQRAVVADDSAWTTGKLVFRDASWARVGGELRRWYGLRLGVADSALHRNTVTATFTADQSVDQVLNVLSLMFGARVERQGDTATIHQGGGSNKVK